MAEARVIPLDPDERGPERAAARARAVARARTRAADAVSTGADRAGGERARRRTRTTPLLQDPAALEGSALEGSALQDPAALQDGAGRNGAGRSESAARLAHPSNAQPRTRPAPNGATRRAATGSAATGSAATGRVRPIHRGQPETGTDAGPGPSSSKPTSSKPTSSKPSPSDRSEPFRGPQTLLGLLGLPEFDLPSVDDAFALLQAGTTPLAALLTAARDLVGHDVLGPLAKLTPDDLDAKLTELFALARRRLAGDLEVDDFGFDPELTEKVIFPLLRPLYRDWFRVEVRGIENIPASGGALLVANHSGVIALDSLMTQVAVYDEHPAHRHLRMLAADLVFDLPVIGELARKTGATLASSADAERLLSSGELVGVWPEGFKGVGKPFGERYKLQRFGRGGFVSAALRTGVPIVPCSIVGAEEIYPMIGNLPTLARLLGVPYFPVTPTFPWLGPLGMLPLPSKWLIEFGEPIDTRGHSVAAAEDPMLVFDLTDQVRQTIQQTLYSLLLQRRSVFF